MSNLLASKKKNYSVPNKKNPFDQEFNALINENLHLK